MLWHCLRISAFMIWKKFNLNRFRFRGALSTASIDDFTRYSKDLADEGTRCFIDADNMRAVSVLNPGTIDEPGHADNTATLKLKKDSTVLCSVVC